MKSICVVLMIALTVATLSGQIRISDGTLNPSQHSLSVIVDGSSTPEQIPDDLAYQHFILAVAEHRNASKEAVTRRELRLKRVGLSLDDQARFVSALDGLREELDSIEQARSELATNSGSQSELAYKALKSREAAAIAKARAGLAHVTADGRARLNDHIRTHVKKHITILGMKH